MPDIIITPSSGKLEFIDTSTQTIRRHAFTLDHNDGIKLDAPLSAAAVIAPLNVINVTVNNSNVNYPLVLASGSAETGTKTLMMDGSGGTYNPFTNTATIDISGNSATTTLASNSTNLGGVAAASYVTLTGTQTLTNKTITGTFTGNLTGTGSWATNAVNANTATNSTQLNGQAASYYTNIPARLGYTPVNKAGDTVTGNLTVNGNFAVNGSVTAFSASNIYITSSNLTVTDNILLMNALSPYQRYAGIQMYDSGSGTLSQLLWDGDGDYFFLTGSSVNGKIITGPDGQTNLSSNYIPKATAGYKLGNSLLYDNGTNVGIGTTSPATKLDVVGDVTMPAIKQSATLYNGTDISDDNSTRTVYFNIPAGGYSPITYFKVARIKITGNYQNVSLNGYFTAANSTLHVGSERKVEFDFIAYAATNAGAPQVTYIKRGQDTTTVLVYAVANGGGAGTTYYDVYIKHGWYNDTHGELAIRVGYSSAVTVWQSGLDSGTSAPVDTLVNPNSNYNFDTTGFVGIGTTTPSRKLHVYSSGLSDNTVNPLLLIDGKFTAAGVDSNDIVGIAFRVENSAGGSQTTTCIGSSYQGAGNALLLQPVSGNVGVGTINPSFKLDIGAAGNDVVSVRLTPGYERVRYYGFDLLGYNDGNLWMIGNNPTNTLVLGKTWDWDNQIGIAYTPGTVGNSGGILQIGQISKNNANYTHGITRLYTNGLERITVIANGNVGIGTTSPGAKLDVNGDIYIRSGYGLYSNIIGPYTGDLTFYTGGSEKMRILSSGGNVGVGTTSPAQKLDVVGNIRCVPASSAWAEGLSFSMPTTSSWGGLRWRRERANADGNHYIGYIGTDTTDDLVFGSNNAGTQIDNNIRITKAGLVGVGTSSPVTKFHVVGVISGSSFSGAGTGLTGTAAGLNIGGNAANITAYTINQNLGTANTPSFAGATINGQLQVNNATPTSILRIFSGGSTAWNIGVGDSSGTNFNITADFGSILINKSTGNIWISGSGINNTVLHSNSTLTAGNLSGTIPSGVLGNSTHYVGTTAIALNRGSASQTLTGVSIDGNAATVGTLSINTSGRNDVANQIVRTDSNGYIQAGWINTTSGDQGTSAINRVYASYDGYIRYYTPANFRTVLDVPTRGGSGASGNWSINATNITAYTINQNVGTGNSPTFAGLISSGNVGIGTTSATARLHVSGSTGGVFEVDTAGGTTNLYVSASGNIGIGTTNPVSKLDVYGPVSLRGTTVLTTNFDLNAGNTNDIYGNIRVLRGASLNDGMFIGYGGAGGPLRFFSNSGTTEFVTIATSGFVGIGSTAPAALLNIRASAPTGIGSTPTGTNLLIDSNTSNYITFRNTSDNGTYAGLIFLDNNVGGYIAFGNAGAAVGSDSMIYGAYQDHIFQNNYVNETLYNRTETMRIKQNGNVGIGSTSPGYKLDVNGTFNATGTATLSTISITGTINSSATETLRTNNNSGYISIYNSAGNTRTGYIQGLAGSSLTLSAENGAFLQFLVGGSERVRINTAGNVGIGTTTPGRKLDVEGIVRTRGASGTGGFEIGAASSGTAKWRIEWDSASDSLDFNWVG
jgi:hypothetical protein